MSDPSRTSGSSPRSGSSRKSGSARPAGPIDLTAEQRQLAHLWLGIPRSLAVPTYYDLLGLQRLEFEPDVIRNVAEWRRSYLSEVAADNPAGETLLALLREAERVLTSPSHKAKYDALLKKADPKRSAPPPLQPDDYPRRWLGIVTPPDGESKALPDHLLIGVVPGERSLETVRHARDQRMNFLRMEERGTGAEAAVAADLIRDLFQAYLREEKRIAALPEAAEEPEPEPSKPDESEPIDDSPPGERRPLWQDLRLQVGGAVLATVTFVGLLLWAHGDLTFPERSAGKDTVFKRLSDDELSRDEADSVPPEPYRHADLLGQLPESGENWEKTPNGLLVKSLSKPIAVTTTFDPPQEYSLSVDWKSRFPQSPAPLGLVFPYRGRPVLLWVNERGRQRTGLMADSTGALAGDSVLPGPLPPHLKDFSGVRCLVRQDGIDVIVHGRHLIRWRGEPEELDCQPEYRPKNPTDVSLLVYEGDAVRTWRYGSLNLGPDDEIDLMPYAVNEGRRPRQRVPGEPIDLVGRSSDAVASFTLEPPEEYRLLIEGERLRGDNQIGSEFEVGYLFQGRPGAADLCWGTRNDVIYWERNIYAGNYAPQLGSGGSAVMGRPLATGKPFRIDWNVTRDGMDVLLDERPILSISQDPLRVFRDPSRITAWPQDLALFAMVNATFRITKVTMLPPKRIPQPLPTDAPPVDLLALIDVERDAFAGEFQRDGDAILAPRHTPDARLIVPYDLPEEYEIHMLVDAPGTEALDCTFPLSDGQGNFNKVTAALAAFSGSGRVSGLWMDVGGFAGNETSVPKVLLEFGTNRIRYIVRRTGVRIDVNDKTEIDYRGSVLRCRTGSGKDYPSNRRMTIGAFRAPYRFRKLELHPLAEPTEPFPEPPPLKAGDDLIARLDFARDGILRQWKVENGILKLDVSGMSDPVGLRFPDRLPEEYRIDFTVRRTSLSESLKLNFPLAGTQADLLLDGYNQKFSGFRNIDFKHLHETESGPQSQPLLPEGKWQRLALEVRRLDSDQYRLRLLRDGGGLREWTGYPLRLHGTVPLDPGSLNLEARSGFEIRNMTFQPLGDSAENSDGSATSAASSASQPQSDVVSALPAGAGAPGARAGARAGAGFRRAGFRGTGLRETGLQNPRTRRRPESG